MLSDSSIMGRHYSYWEEDTMANGGGLALWEFKGEVPSGQGIGMQQKNLTGYGHMLKQE